MRHSLIYLSGKKLTISLLFLVFIFSCKKLDSLMTFTISNESDFTVNSATPVNVPMNVSSPDVATNSSQEFKNNNANSKMVKDIHLNKLQLSISNPQNQSFSFLKSIHIYISTNSSNEIELAWLDSIPNNTTTIELTPTPAKLDDYIKASSYSLRTSVVTREVPTQDIDIKISSKFKVSANL